MREPIAVTDVMASGSIRAPLRLLDCCLISDGGAAIIVSARDAARDLRQPPVLLLGAGQQHTHEHIVASGSLTEFGCKQSAAQAFWRAGLAQADIDVAGLYRSEAHTSDLQSLMRSSYAVVFLKKTKFPHTRHCRCKIVS